MSLPDGVRRVSFDGRPTLATQGPTIGDEPVVDGWRQWDARRSKLAAMLEADLPVRLASDDRVLYLGAAAGTTVSHVADVAGPTYAVEFAARPMRDLVSVADARPRLFPLLKDARDPTSYAHVVEPVDVVCQDVATRGQAAVALANRRFLRADGRLYLAIKARSEDVTAAPSTVYERVLSELRTGYAIEARVDLAPEHDAHLGVVARPAD